MKVVPVGHAVWVAEDLEGPEQLLRFTLAGGEPLTIVSNQPYELWLDGRFHSDGGHRCVAGEALSDRWPATADADDVVVRVHWIDPCQPGFTGRLAFDDPFVACLERAASAWRGAEREGGVRFGVRASGHLPRQTVTSAEARAPSCRPLTIAPVERDWSYSASPIEAPRYVALAPALVADRSLAALTGELPWTDAGELACLVGWVTERRPALRCQTFDLGTIAHHRFELDAPDGLVVVCGSEVSELERLTTEGRGRVALADGVAGSLSGVALNGLRGCRYLHVFSRAEAREAPTLRAWRREYRFRWKEVSPAPEDAALVQAARNNLIACVDGGIVDSCWRERAQWTGDLRMGAIALRALADDPEVTALGLRQIADSYDEASGMVAGLWPAAKRAVLPTYHLAFCLAALEHDLELRFDPKVRHAVLHSLDVWRASYLRADLVVVPPSGWTFTDWERGGIETMGYGLPSGAPHAVLNGWWVQVCERLGQPSGVDRDAFEAALGHPSGYLLLPANADVLKLMAEGRRQSAGAAAERLPEGALEVSPHATAVVIASGLAQGDRRAAGLSTLRALWRAGELRRRLTPYFAYFVAEALATEDPELAAAFVRDVYGEEAARLGTITEKGTDQDSLAHGWSVAYVRFLT